MRPRPVIGLCADQKFIEPHYYQCVGEKYLRAVAEAADGVPMILPSLSDGVLPDELLSLVDGLVLTGSYANVHPEHYGGGEPYEGSPLDRVRDDATLRLIPAALESAVPLFGICRGFQEMNVALGGSLLQKVHEHPDYDVHHENANDPLEKQYGPAHPVTLEADGLLRGLSDSDQQVVNSVHGQGVDRLAGGVNVEARAPDGLVEGFTVAGAESFALAVQWHPEWRPLENPFYTAIWQAFGAACRERAAQRRR